MFGGPKVSYHQTHLARDWLTILRTPNSTQNLQRKSRTDDKLDEYRGKWFLHLQRMPQNRIPLKAYWYSPQGKRKIGRPKKRWREQL